MKEILKQAFICVDKEYFESIGKSEVIPLNCKNKAVCREKVKLTDVPYIVLSLSLIL